MSSTRQQSRRRIAVLLVATVLFPGTAVAAEKPPSTTDTNLEILLVAADPDIVTPIGAATDAAGRLSVVESLTHARPPDYRGPISCLESQR